MTIMFFYSRFYFPSFAINERPSFSNFTRTHYDGVLIKIAFIFHGLSSWRTPSLSLYAMPSHSRPLALPLGCVMYLKKHLFAFLQRNITSQNFFHWPDIECKKRWCIPIQICQMVHNVKKCHLVLVLSVDIEEPN